MQGGSSSSELSSKVSASATNSVEEAEIPLPLAVEPRETAMPQTSGTNPCNSRGLPTGFPTLVAIENDCSRREGDLETLSLSEGRFSSTATK
jgi:hypothetical protein